MPWFLSLEVQIQSDERPIPSIVFLERPLDDWTYAFEEIIFERWSRRFRWSIMRKDGERASSSRIGVPRKVLLDRQRRSSRQCTIDPIGPPFAVWIAVVGVQQHAATGTEDRGRLN